MTLEGRQSVEQGPKYAARQTLMLIDELLNGGGHLQIANVKLMQ